MLQTGNLVKRGYNYTEGEDMHATDYAGATIIYYIFQGIEILETTI